MQTALVTGAAGFIGSHLVRGLLDRGFRVRGLDDLSTGREQNLADVRDDPGFSFIRGDIRDEETVAEAVRGVDQVYHQAAVASVPRSVEDPQSATDVNCGGTATLVDAIRQSDVERLVVALSSAVYGSDAELPASEDGEERPESPYALSKYYTEQLAIQASELYGVGTVALRYFNVFGPRQDPEGDYAAVIPTFIQLMLNGERPTIYGDGEQSRDFVYVQNAVEANISAARSDCSGEAINVACGRRITISELVDRLNEALGTDFEPRYTDPRPGDVRHSVADVSRARELIDYEPEVGLRDGLERTVAFYRNQQWLRPSVGEPGSHVFPRPSNAHGLVDSPTKRITLRRGKSGS